LIPKGAATLDQQDLRFKPAPDALRRPGLTIFRGPTDAGAANQNGKWRVFISQ
jgi:hypothetical protein